MLQVIIVNNHMNGKDTHVRGLKILGPIECVISVHDITESPDLSRSIIRNKLQPHEEPFPFKHPSFRLYQGIR